MQEHRDYFSSRRLVIATKHGKERVMAPLLEAALGVQCFVPEGIDTDTLGTFTGEVERRDDPITTLRNKCLMGMEIAGCDLGVATEGSFGPHPTLIFASSSDELVMLIDRRHGLEIVGRELSADTNFNGSEVTSLEELRAFAARCLFPSHGLILRNAKDGHQGLVKGIADWPTLERAFHATMSAYGAAYAETDMRAMRNPTRMRVIGRATEKLLAAIASACPRCGAPGFVVTEAIPGLPCGLCLAPTRSTRIHVYACARCHHSEQREYPHGRTAEDPMFCDACNP